MISIDSYIIGFVNVNWLTITLFLGLLKAAAKMTPWVWDDSIHVLLAGLLGIVRKESPTEEPK